MHKKKIILVSFAALPWQTPRSLRTTELAKGLAKAGHEVILYVITKGHDFTKFERETGVKVKSLGKMRFLKFNYKKGIDYSFFTKVIKKITGRLFEFPYIELVQKTNKVLKSENDIDLLISIAVPYTIHWGVALHKQLYPSKFKETIWVSDCGDPYMGNAFFKYPFYFKYVEKWFFSKTDFISIPTEDAKVGYYPEFHNKIVIIPQGFDFGSVNVDNVYKGNAVPTFIYAGMFYEKNRDPRPLLDYLIQLETDFRFIIYTKHRHFLDDYTDILKNKLIINNYIPREKMLLEMSKADFLLNLENPSKIQSPSKLIDYSLSKRPILSINTNNELDTNLIKMFLEGNYKRSLVVEHIEQYDIDNVVNKFLMLAK